MSVSDSLPNVDLLRWPIVGPFLRWRHARTSLQIGFLAAAVVVVLHGFFGPDVASANLATTLVWVHYRGFLVLALLAAGNLFCAGCPFIRVRDWGRLLHAPSRKRPSWLRGKWAAVGLFAAVLYTYELFDLWSLPLATTYLVLAYFVGALVVDLVFTGATFCKHLCPVGQFNFIASTLSPLEIRARDHGICASCQTVDCLKGRTPAPGLPPPRGYPGPGAGQKSFEKTSIGVADLNDSRAFREPPRGGGSPGAQRGCELQLFVPTKVGNLECTFCFDCVQACPYDNVALATRIPGEELADDRRRSLIGRLSKRPDLAALALVFTFGAFVNAFAMTSPVFGVEALLAWMLGTPREWPALLLIFAAGLITLPLVACGTAAAGTFLVSDRTRRVQTIAITYAYALIPLGAGLWLAHYGFHFLTGAGTIVPVTQRAALDTFGRAVLGEPAWGWLGLKPGQVFPLQIGAILLGALGSAILVQRISDRDHADRALAAAAPWMLLLAALTGAALWILSQPMDMRGMGMLS